MATVFLTGATGFVGGAILAQLLADARVEQVVLLVRSRDSDHADERVVEALGRFDVRMPGAGRVVVVRGALNDFILPREILGRLTHVVHAAAHTSFRSVRTARETNVEGTRSLARALMGAAKLERFLFVGTAYRLGVADVGLVQEDMRSSDQHVAEYTRTKAEAEVVLEEASRLPLVIARPSIVVGHTRLGVKPSASLFWYYRALAKAGISPFSDVQLRDIVPVDWAAGASVHLLLKRSLARVRYHISAGEGSSETWAAIRNRFAELGQASPAHERVQVAALSGHPAWTVAGFQPWTVSAITECARFSQLPYGAFSNERILAEGLEPPPRFTTYIETCLASSDRTVDEQARDDV
jgi:nucleoside-diphosphate-sugar epimerase